MHSRTSFLMMDRRICDQIKYPIPHTPHTPTPPYPIPPQPHMPHTPTPQRRGQSGSCFQSSPLMSLQAAPWLELLRKKGSFTVMSASLLKKKSQNLMKNTVDMNQMSRWQSAR